MGNSLFKRVLTLFGEQAFMELKYSRQMDGKKFTGMKKITFFPMIWDEVGFIYIYQDEILTKKTVTAKDIFNQTLRTIFENLASKGNLKNHLIEVSFLEEWWALLFQRESSLTVERDNFALGCIQELSFLHAHDGTKVTYIYKDSQPTLLERIYADLVSSGVPMSSRPSGRLSSLVRGFPKACALVPEQIVFDRVRIKSYNSCHEAE